MYITIQDNIITGVYCGDQIENYIEVPDSFNGMVGDVFDLSNSKTTNIKKQKSIIKTNLKTLSLVEEIKLGIKELERGTKIVNDTIVSMSFVEKIEAGLEILPQGWKIDGDKICEMRDEEKIEKGLLPLPNGFELANGEIKEIETKEVLEQRERKKLEQYLNLTDWYAIRMIERKIEIPDEIRIKRLEAVKRLNEIKIG